jgi:membrane protein
VEALDRLRTRVDLAQQRRRPLAFVIGVVLRWRDDRGGRWAAVVGYYGFFSIFPLLLSFVTVLGIVLQDRPTLRGDIIDSALGRFPVIGTQLGADGLSGNPLVVALGLLTALWAGTAAVQALQDAINTMWSVPHQDQPSFLVKRARSLALVVFIGVCLVGAAAVTSLATAGLGMHRVVVVLTFVASVAVNIVLVGGAYRIILDRDIATRALVPGACAAGVGLSALQSVGVLYVTRVLKDSSDTYGVFAAVIALLTWLTLQGQVVLLGNEINVVRAGRLWPRSLRRDHPTEADVRAARELATRAAAAFEVDVLVVPPPDEASDHDGRPAIHPGIAAGRASTQNGT